MTGLLEPVALYGGGSAADTPLPAAMHAPGDVGYADIYWRGVQDHLINPGDALIMRDETWLVEGVVLWAGSPGGTHAKVRSCDTTGQLFKRTAVPTAYGAKVTTSPDGIPFVGVLGVALSSEDGGSLSSTADLTPAGLWQGAAGDLLVLSDGSRWEQQGDVTERTTAGGTWAGRKSRLPVVHVRRVRDGSVNE